MGDIINFPGGADHEPVPTFLVKPVLTDEHYVLWEMAQAFNDESNQVDVAQKGLLQQALEDLSFAQDGVPGIAFPLQPELYIRNDILPGARRGFYSWGRETSPDDSHVPSLPAAYYEIVSMNARREIDGDVVCLLRCLDGIDGYPVDLDMSLPVDTVFPALFSELYPIVGEIPIPIDLMEDLQAQL